jgi:hypothetical protein
MPFGQAHLSCNTILAPPGALAWQPYPVGPPSVIPDRVGLRQNLDSEPKFPAIGPFQILCWRCFSKTGKACFLFPFSLFLKMT